MQTISYTTSAGSSPTSRSRWIEEIEARFGLQCRLDAGQASHSTITQWHAGPLKLSHADLARQSLSPTVERRQEWFGEYIVLKQIESGSLMIEQNGERRRIDAGGIVLIDPARPFNDYFSDATRLIAVRIPRQSLRDRGIRYTLNNLHIPDTQSPDVIAVRDYLSCIARNALAISAKLLDRFGDQFIDYTGAMLDTATDPAPARSAAALALRARQLIARSIGDSGLNVPKIAAALNVSANYLSRVFRAEGLSPMSYVWSVRLEHAARLLADTPADRLKSKEVASRYGFTNASNFSRAFRERYGVTPLEFARRAHEANEAHGTESGADSRG